MNTRDLRAELARLCELWDFPLGPFRTEEEVYHQMLDYAAKLGPENGALLADIINEWASSFAHIQVLSDLATLYLRKYPQFTVELLRHLNSQGPALIIDLLGESKEPGVSEKLLAAIDPERVNEELQIAFFGAMGSFKDAASRKYLESVDDRKFSAAVQDEIRVARINNFGRDQVT